MLQNKLVTVGAHTYNISQLPAIPSTRALVKITNTLGNVPVALATGVVGEDTSQVRQAFLLSVLSAMKDLQEDTILELLELLFDAVSVRGVGPLSGGMWQTHFHGATLDMWQVAMAVIRINYADFFVGVLSLFTTSVGQDLTPQNEPPASPPT